MFGILKYCIRSIFRDPLIFAVKRFYPGHKFSRPFKFAVRMKKPTFEFRDTTIIWTPQPKNLIKIKQLCLDRWLKCSRGIIFTAQSYMCRQGDSQTELISKGNVEWTTFSLLVSTILNAIYRSRPVASMIFPGWGIPGPLQDSRADHRGSGVGWGGSPGMVQKFKISSLFTVLEKESILKIYINI